MEPHSLVQMTKPGVAEIMTAAAYLLSHKEIPHGKICIGFTPMRRLAAAQTGLRWRILAHSLPTRLTAAESLVRWNTKTLTLRLPLSRFMAAVCTPETQKQGMVNSMLIGMEYRQMLPTFEESLYTEGYEGFFHLDHFNGDVETSMMKYLIRDHDMEKFEKKKSKCARLQHS